MNSNIESNGNAAIDFLNHSKWHWVNTGRKSKDWKVKIFQHDSTGLQLAIYDRDDICTLLEYAVEGVPGTEVKDHRPKSHALDIAKSKFATLNGCYYKVTDLESFRQLITKYSHAQADHLLSQNAKRLGYNHEGEIKIGGNYVPWVRDGNLLYLSGQIPRVGDMVVVTGTAGDVVTLAQAQHAAQVCAIRALTLVKHALGSLSYVQSLPRMTVYVQSAGSFTPQSEVADAASALLFGVLGVDAGAHTRTSVGVLQLPKNATVEIDFIVSVKSD